MVEILSVGTDTIACRCHTSSLAMRPIKTAIIPSNLHHCFLFFRVEMFLMPDGSVSINEVAPRPHNSGHYTQNACTTSQFEQHLRCVLGWPLGGTSLQAGAAIMYNIIGEVRSQLHLHSN